MREEAVRSFVSFPGVDGPVKGARRVRDPTGQRLALQIDASFSRKSFTLLYGRRHTPPLLQEHERGRMGRATSEENEWEPC